MLAAMIRIQSRSFGAGSGALLFEGQILPLGINVTLATCDS